MAAILTAAVLCIAQPLPAPERMPPDAPPAWAAAPNVQGPFIDWLQIFTGAGKLILDGRAAVAEFLAMVQDARATVGEARGAIADSRVVIRSYTVWHLFGAVVLSLILRDAAYYAIDRFYALFSRKKE